MTHAEFIEVTSEMEKFYDKKYPIEQSKIMYEELGKLSKERYRQVSREVYRKSKFMPKLADLVEIEKELPRQVQEVKKVECERCEGLGLVTYWREFKDGDAKRKYLYGARCTCANGLKYMHIPSIEQVGVYNE